MGAEYIEGSGGTGEGTEGEGCGGEGSEGNRWNVTYVHMKVHIHDRGDVIRIVCVWRFKHHNE